VILRHITQHLAMILISDGKEYAILKR
jgi:hypothetical protein